MCLKYFTSESGQVQSVTMVTKMLAKMFVRLLRNFPLAWHVPPLTLVNCGFCM